MKKTLSFYTIFLLAVLIIARVSGLLSKMIITRYISPYEFGIIVLVAISLPTMFEYLANSCFYNILSHSTEGKKYFSFSLIYSLVISSIIIVLVSIFHREFFNFLNIDPSLWRLLIFALAIYLIPRMVLVNLLGLFRGLRMYSIATKIPFISPVIKLCIVLIVFMLFNFRNFVLALIAFTIPPLIVVAIVLILKRKLVLSLLSKNISVPPKNIFLFGLSIFFVQIFWSTTEVISKIVITHDLGVVMAGYFDISLSLVTLLSFPIIAMRFISIPEATYAKNEDTILRYAEFTDAIRGLFFLVVFLTILVFFFSNQFIELLFTENYSAAADYIFIVAIGYVFVFIQQFISYINISLREPLEYKFFIFTTIVLIFLFPVITHVFIYFTGFVGAYISVLFFSLLYTMLTILSFNGTSMVKVLLWKVDRMIVTILITSTFILISKNIINFIFCSILSGLLFIFFGIYLGYLNRKVFNLFKEILKMGT